MAWIESHEDIWDHHKLYRLCTAVNQPDYAVVGRLHSLWHWVLRNAWKDADLTPWGDEIVEKVSRWDGEKGVWLTALRECGFLDGFVVHGWLKRAGRLVQDRRRNERRKAQQINGGKTAVKRRMIDRQSVATVPNPTVPYPTEPNQDPKSSQPAGEAARFTPTELLSLWNNTAHPNLPRVQMITPKREQSIRVLLRTFPDRDWWARYFMKVNESPFLTGQNGKSWRCNFDWVLNKTNMAKITEGNYATDSQRKS